MTARIPAWVATPLFAAYAVLRVAAASPGDYSTIDLVVTLMAAIVVSAGLAAVAHFVAVRLGAGAGTVAVVDITVSAAVALFFLGPALSGLLQTVNGFDLRIRHVFLGIVVTVGAARLRGSTLAQASRFVSTAAVVLVVAGCVHTVAGQVATLRTQPAEAPAEEVIGHLTPAPGRANGVSSARDIYLLVLDARANGTALLEHLGFDDRTFTDSLRALGFVIPDRFRSNHIWTVLSLPTLLNFRHDERLHAGEGTSDRSSLARKLIERNRSAEFLRARGYRYHLFPSEWYAATASSSLADETFRAVPTWHPQQLLGTELRRALFRGTLVGRIGLGDPTIHARRSFDGLTRVPADTGPTFVLAHFLLPHDPYVFAEGCRPQRQDADGDIEIERKLYVRQVQCTNELVIAAVTAILARSRETPIIAIVGDHGSRIHLPKAGAEPVVTGPGLSEGFDAFGAFLTPGAPAAAFAGDLTLVNVMQRLLTAYFSVDIPASPDRFFTSGYTTRFELVEVRPEGGPIWNGELHAPPD